MGDLWADAIVGGVSYIPGTVHLVHGHVHKQLVTYTSVTFKEVYSRAEPEPDKPEADKPEADEPKADKVHVHSFAGHSSAVTPPSSYTVLGCG